MSPASDAMALDGSGRAQMRLVLKTAVLLFTALSAAAALIATPVVTLAVTLAATALIMGGTSHPLSVPEDTPEFIAGYVHNAAGDYIAPSGLCGAGCPLVAVHTPEEIKFVTGWKDMTFDQSVALGRQNLNDCVQGRPCTVTLAPYTQTGPPRTVSDSAYVVYSYSESSTVATDEKRYLIAHPAPADVSFLMLANPNRPNGGILERFAGVHIPILGVTFNGATPTDSPRSAPLTTVDIARQYDGWADFPTNPLNLLSDLNALVGTVLVHGNYFGVGTPELQGQYQDTTYYLVPTPVVPLLMPLTWIPLGGRALAIALDPALRVLVETGYDRTTNPGAPTPARYFYVPNLVHAAVDFAVAVPTGWDNAISYLTHNPTLRPFHTKVPDSPYGVGGPPVYTNAVDPYGDPTPYAATPSTAEAAPAAVLQRRGREHMPQTAPDSPNDAALQDVPDVRPEDGTVPPEGTAEAPVTTAADPSPELIDRGIDVGGADDGKDSQGQRPAPAVRTGPRQTFHQQRHIQHVAHRARPHQPR
ncbi:PE-PPE domain-containing protein [Mycolicibacterium chubuense NBB4]|uniref:PE-PPE domain-containing protein n=1 Tax=Mycolicibacterium chubuense (strain NBB4) TaxID=710421 RepID=I4BNI7_MYCCN|nr:PE-PPE domain-containing protein [Mycolicibacterium chubuense]AFM18844.1 PE-PPE domain-containing protein [Mycolicibacterium chubuense NBB4]